MGRVYLENISIFKRKTNFFTRQESILMRIIAKQAPNVILRIKEIQVLTYSEMKCTLLGIAELFFSTLFKGWLWLTDRVGWILRVINSGLSSIMFCSCSGVLTRVLFASKIKSPGLRSPCLSMTEFIMILATITFPDSSVVTVRP